MKCRCLVVDRITNEAMREGPRQRHKAHRRAGAAMGPLLQGHGRGQLQEAAVVTLMILTTIYLSRISWPLEKVCAFYLHSSSVLPTV